MSNLTKFRILPPAHAAKSTVEQILQHYTAREAETRGLLLFDATGSMQPYWNHVLGTIHQIVERLLHVQHALSLKIVAYRDDCDGDQILDQSGWSRDAEVLTEFVGRVTCAGGGDWPEAVDRALQVATEETTSVSAVVLIGDAPPHANRPGLREAKRLAELHRPVFPILVGDAADTRAAFSAIAVASGGRLVSLERLDDLYDVLGVVLAHGAGSDVMDAYVKRYGRELTSGARKALLMLSDGHNR